MTKYFREPVNGFTHLFGAMLSSIGLLFMIIKTCSNFNSPLELPAVLVFGISLIMLYSASAIYHLVIAPSNVIKFLRKLDHSMIFVLIAGTYTPVCLIALNGSLRWVIFSIIWTLSIAGILFKMLWFDCPRWLSTSIYIILGWLVVLVFSPLVKYASVKGITWLVLGGILYTVGGIIYALKPNKLKFKFLGFHEIFHIFILLGSISHFIFIFKYIM